ncbi:MAG: hypothetical protein ABJE95_30335 [Byssovorax sp.]
MIRIHRGEEPPDLADARSKHLPRLRAIAAIAPPTSDQIYGYGLPEVRKALWLAQHDKCCYCEKHLDSADPLDHHRPKTKARRAPGSELTHGYWWLAHSWLNLLYACNACNSGKRESFPLEPGSTLLAADEAPPGGELALLIDPASTNGMLHIQFELMHIDGAKDKWTPRPRTRFGESTIKVCKLDRGSLLDDYRRHVTQFMMPYVDRVKVALQGTDPREVHRAVDMATRVLLCPTQRFIGLSYDALQHFIPDARLTHYNLAWHRPA